MGKPAAGSPCAPLHYDRHCATLRATTNPHDRCGLTIWLEGGKPALAGFFVSGVIEMQGTPEPGNRLKTVLPG